MARPLMDVTHNDAHSAQHEPHAHPQLTAARVIPIQCASLPPTPVTNYPLKPRGKRPQQAVTGAEVARGERRIKDTSTH